MGNPEKPKISPLPIPIPEKNEPSEKDGNKQAIAKIKLRQRKVEQLVSSFINSENPNKKAILEKAQKKAEAEEGILTYLAEMREGDDEE